MVFSSLPFLFFYLMAVLAVYKLSPLKIRNLILLLVSLFFYGWGEPVYIFIMLLSIAVDYTHGRLVERWRENDKLARRVVASSVICNLAILFFFKYWDFIAVNLNSFTGLSLPILGLPLPIGISFYTFQTMSYTIDVYRRDAPPQKNIISFGAYVTLFPQLIAGPIVRYKTIAGQLESRREDLEKFASGVTRFTAGLAKKVLLANAVGQLWDAALENFNYPYISRSVVEFWRRWHISLTAWFREYVYFPLGGSRVSRGKWVRNILIVWLLTGIWHGAGWNFLLWGLYYALFMLLERLLLGEYLKKLPAALGRLYTMAVVLVGWALFAVEDMGALAVYFRSLLGASGLWSVGDWYSFRTSLPLLALLAVGSTPLAARIWSRLGERGRSLLGPVLVLGGLILCTAALVDASYNPFLYFRF